jgi:hypothetical protein
MPESKDAIKSQSNQRGHNRIKGDMLLFGYLGKIYDLEGRKVACPLRFS